MKWENEKENLERYINKGLSYESIGKLYGCTGANIKKRAKKLGINLLPKRRINEKETFNKGTAKKGVCAFCGKEYVLYASHSGKYCSHECQNNDAKKQIIENWKNGTYNGYNARVKISKVIRDYLLDKNEYKCEVCGFSGVNPYTNKTILQIHHKNGDATDCSEDNLQVLCPNCHAMTENFGSRNKNSRRGYRREEYKNKPR